MMQLTSPGVVYELLRRYNLRWRKSLGQNFLADSNIVDKIVRAAGVEPGDTVVEIGAGLGTLTIKLSEKAGKVIAVEVDRNLIPVLEETLQDRENVKIIQADALEVNFDELVLEYTGVMPEEGYIVVGNLPYYITTPVLMHLLENRFNYSVMVVMVQHEVARRMTASPGTKDYGALSIAVQYYTTAEIVGKVSKNVFIPKPEVGSAVVKMQKRRAQPVDPGDEKVFFSLVRAAFGKRRKTLLNALSSSPLEVSKEEWNNIIKEAGINPAIRGETLGMQDFAALTRCYKSTRYE